MSICNKNPVASIVMIATTIGAVLISSISLIIGNDDVCYGLLVLGILSGGLAISAIKRSHTGNAIAIAYITRLIICILYTVQNDGDADGYGIYAVQFAAMPISDVFSSIPTGAYFYSWVISFLFRVFGENYMPVRAMNMAISVYCVYIAIDVVDLIYGNKKTTNVAAWCMALFPNLIRFSSYFANREPLLMIFTLLYIKHSYIYYLKNNKTHLFLSVVFLIPAMILHTSMIIMIALTVLIILSRKDKYSSRLSNALKKGLLAGGLIVFYIYMLSNGVGTEKLGVGGGVELSISGISSIGNMSAEGRAAYLKGVSFSNPILTILFLPIRMMYFLYTPFLWMIRNLVDIAGLFDALLYIYLSIAVIKKSISILKCDHKSTEEKFILMLLLVLVVIVAMFAAVTSNYGTAIRHRCKLFPIFLFIAVDGIQSKIESIIIKK